MTLFASVSAGTNKEIFQSRADAYSKIIGSIDAFNIQTRAKLYPQTRAGEAVNKLLENKELLTSKNAVPSAVALAGISKTITELDFPH